MESNANSQQEILTQAFEIAKAVLLGYKVRKIMNGRRLKNMIQRLRKLDVEITQIVNDKDTIKDTIVVNQLILQLKRKKELFLNTLNELLLTPHWYTASEMSDNIKNRKR